MVDKNAVEDFLDAIKQPEKTTNNTYSAVVTRIDDKNIVWVQIAGSDKETPTSSTSSEVKRGDSVNVQWRNNRLYISGNYSNPSAGVTRVANVETAAQVANRAAQNAVTDAGVARDAAESAQASATNAAASAQTAKDIADNASGYASRALGNLATVQSVAETLTWITAHGTMTLTSDVALDPTHVYFVVDAGGDYTVGGTTYAIVTEPDVADIGTYYELSIDESLNNYVGTHLALTGEGLWLLPASSGTNKVLIATGAGTTYTTAGTYLIDDSGNTVASFRADGATMSSGNTQIAHLGYGEGTSSNGTSTAPYYTLGTRKTTATPYSSASTYSAGDMVVYNGSMYVCITNINTAEAWTPSHWVYYIGNYSTANGRNAIASSICSHAEGATTSAVGQACHAEGTRTIARGLSAHAEGQNTLAYGDASHAQNSNTTAMYSNQTVIGRYNDNKSVNAFEIGNGYSATPSNAFEVDWNGNVNIASGAKYKIGGTDISASDVGAVPTTRTVNNKALSSNISLDASDVGAAPAPVFSNVSDDNGCVVIGKLAMAWGTVNVTSGTSGSPSGGVTTYAGSETVDWSSLYGITFKNKPSVSLTWSGNYANQVSISTYGTTTTSMTVYGRMLSSSQTRGIRWFVCGQLA